MSLEDQVNEAGGLARASKLAAIVALIVFLALGFLISRNVLQLSELEGEIHDREATVEDLNSRKEELLDTIYGLRFSEADEIRVRADQRKVPGVASSTYDFSIWIDLSSYRKKELTQVTYRTIEPTAPFQERVADNAVNGFSISYRGTECLGRMSIEIEFADQSKQTVEFEMCQEL